MYTCLTNDVNIERENQEHGVRLGHTLKRSALGGVANVHHGGLKVLEEHSNHSGVCDLCYV
jgi:hypothetical protein